MKKPGEKTFLFIVLIGMLSLFYLTVFFAIGTSLLIGAAMGTTVDLNTGEIFQFQIENPVLLIITFVVTMVFFLVCSIHRKNKKNQEEKKLSYKNLIGIPTDLLLKKTNKN